MKIIPTFPINNSSSAEEKIFQLIKKIQLDSDWLAYHSLNISEHEYKDWADRSLDQNQSATRFFLNFTNLFTCLYPFTICTFHQSRDFTIPHTILEIEFSFIQEIRSNSV